MTMKLVRTGGSGDMFLPLLYIKDEIRGKCHQVLQGYSSLQRTVCVYMCVCVFGIKLAYKSASSANTVYAKQEEYSSHFYNRSGPKRPEAACKVQNAGCSVLVMHNSSFQRGKIQVEVFQSKREGSIFQL